MENIQDPPDQDSVITLDWTPEYIQLKCGDVLFERPASRSRNMQILDDVEGFTFRKILKSQKLSPFSSARNISSH